MTWRAERSAHPLHTKKHFFSPLPPTLLSSSSVSAAAAAATDASLAAAAAWVQAFCTESNTVAWPPLPGKQRRTQGARDDAITSLGSRSNEAAGKEDAKEAGPMEVVLFRLGGTNDCDTNSEEGVGPGKDDLRSCPEGAACLADASAAAEESGDAATGRSPFGEVVLRLGCQRVATAG
mmetsp:Transcript_28482/g.57362  ORF Transcript_28482/g.57362 Transcript_28482/m.57362 type:complete len:178 (+) Transcript_28482:390-923(+)